MKRAWAVGLAGFLGGCQTSDEGAIASGDEGSTTDTPNPSSSAGTTDPSGSGGTAPSDGSDEGIETGEDVDEATAGEGDTTAGDPLDPSALEPCEGVDCGAGSCSIDAEGHPLCNCPAGMLAAGLECYACTEVSGLYDIDIEATDFSVNLTIAGEAPPNMPTEIGELWLRNPATDEMIALGITNGAPLHARVVPTGYEVVYRRRLGALLPANRDAVVAVIDAAKTSQLELNLVLTRIEGDFSFDGMAAPASAAENGRVWLRGPAGDEVYLGETRYGSYLEYVLPGLYTIEYEALTSGDTAPRNKRAIVGTLEVLAEQSEVALVQNIDIATVRLTGDFMFDGSAAPQSETERARVFLRDVATDDEFAIGETNYGSYDVLVAPGNYEVVYQYLAGSNVMPANSHAVVGTIDTFAGSGQDIDIATVSVSGAFTIDGTNPPSDPSDDGRITLRNLATGDDVLLGTTTTGTFDRIVVAGQYTVHYGQDTSSLIAPANANAQIDAVDVAATPAFDVDVPTAFVSGLITIGAGAPPDSDYDDGWLYLREPTTGDTVLLANTRMGQFATPVVPGTYEVVYAVETPGGQVPINVDSVVLDTVDVEGGTMFDIDIPVQPLNGTITAVTEAGERASLYLAAQGATARSLLGNTSDAAYGQPVIPGFYLVSYGADTVFGGLPENSNAPLSCIELVGK